MCEINLIDGDDTASCKGKKQTMRLTYKDTSNFQSSAKKMKPLAHVPSSPSNSSKFSSPADLSPISNYNRYQERPLKTNSQNLSFKGLFYKPVLDAATKSAKTFDSEEILGIVKKHLGSSAEELFNSVKNSDLKTAKEMFHQDGSKVSFSKKTIGRLIYDGAMYPIKTLPGDILNGIVGALRKVGPLKNWAEKQYNSPLLKNLRQKSKMESKVNALRGLFETVEANKGKSDKELSNVLFQRSVKMFDPKSGNYDTKHERSLNRIVSGSIPAFFLANDAYNLARMCDDKKDSASKEKKTRFKQELSRIGLNAYITLVTLGALQKYINNSKLGIVLNTGLTVLFTESFARLSNGKHITRLTPEQAKAINQKKNEEPNKGNSDYREVFFKSDDKANIKNKSMKPDFKGNGDKADNKATGDKAKAPILSFGTLMKASAVVIATGLGIKGLRKISTVDKAFKAVLEPFGKLYKKLTVNPEFTIESGKFDQIIKHLEESGFEELAAKYKSVGESSNRIKAFDKFKASLSKDEVTELNELEKSFKTSNEKSTIDDFVTHFQTLDKSNKPLVDKYNKIHNEILSQKVVHLGAKDKKQKPVIDFVIAPFKFLFNTVKLPYSLTDRALKMFNKSKPKPADSSKDAIKALATSIDKISAEAFSKKYTPEKFKSFVSDSILKAFNVDNMSSISNSDLSNLAKTSATAATIWFLMTDNYNMVMLKSNGEDKSGAELKFKERFVQEGSRLFYQTLLIDLFNSSFRKQYNSSLWGMSWITATNTTIGEILNRKSIGMPVKAHTRDELVAIETKKQNATGFVRGYYNFMARLTGKKTLQEQRSMKDAKKAEVKTKA